MSPYFKVLMNYWPSTYVGTFNSGHKVFYERLGFVEVKCLLRAIPLDALVSYHIYILESQEREYVCSLLHLRFGASVRVVRCGVELLILTCFASLLVVLVCVFSRRRQIKTRGYSLPFINVQDCDGLGMKHAYGPGIDFLKSLTKIDEANYPEMVHQIFFINTPSVFNVLYKMLQPFIPQTTVDKVRLSKDELVSLLPPDFLPPQLGGCAVLAINNGGVIEDKDVFPEGKRVTVPAGSTHSESYTVMMPGATLHIHFSCEANDIGFSLLFKENEGDKETRVLVGTQRYDADKIASHIEYPTQEPGVYIASWDNSYSKWTSKSIFYHILEVSPIQQAQILDEVLRTDPVMGNSNGFLLPKVKKN